LGIRYAQLRSPLKGCVRALKDDLELGLSY
jgi:hypothetical protein